MEKINLPFFYNFGYQLNALTKLENKVEKRIEIFVAANNVEPGLVFLLNPPFKLTFCAITGRELWMAIKEIQKWFRETDSKKWSIPDYRVTTKFNKVISKAKEFETLLSAELQTLAVYHVTQKGIYSTSDLIERTEKIFPYSIFSKLDSKIIEEVRQSGKCLAFDCATASAFHIMRALELVIHDYYIFVCKPKPKPKERLPNWGAYILELNKLQKPKVKELVAMIQQIKDQHRNLIMHPEIVLTPEEAFTLFGIAQGAILAMAEQLPQKKKQKWVVPPITAVPPPMVMPVIQPAVIPVIKPPMIKLHDKKEG